MEEKNKVCDNCAEESASAKKTSFLKRHWVFFTVIGLLFLSTFFVRGSSVQMRYSQQDTYEYVRLDYSIYGYCINVRPMQETSKQAARDLSRQVLFMDIDGSVEHIAEQWTYYFGDEATFTFKVKGYMYNTNDRRDELIQTVRELGYKADAII